MQSERPGSERQVILSTLIKGWLWDLVQAAVCRAFSGVSCEPYAGDSAYRANPDHKHAGDSFNIWRPDPHYSRSLCLQRKDWHGGWGMNLEIACPVDNSQVKVLIPLGPSPVLIRDDILFFGLRCSGGYITSYALCRHVLVTRVH